MQEQNIQDIVRGFLSDRVLMSGPMALEEGQSFLRAGVLDSTGVLELVAFLEDSFAIHVADLEIVPENLDSLRAVEGFVRRKQAEA